MNQIAGYTLIMCGTTTSLAVIYCASPLCETTFFKANQNSHYNPADIHMQYSSLL